MSAAEQREGESMATEQGYAIRTGADGYFDMNGIGDWSLAGGPEDAYIFATPDEAREAIKNNDLDFAAEVEIVPITREIIYHVGHPIDSVPA